MAHDESGSLAASLPPAIQALASGKRSEPGPTERAAAYAFGVTQRADQPGWWGGDVWEHVRNYRGAVALAIEPYIKFFLGADYRAYRKRKGVRKSLANGFSKFARDDEYEPLDDDHPVSQILKHPGGEDGAWTIGFEMAFAYLQYAITGQAPIWTPLNRDGKPCQLYALVAAGITSAYPPGSPSYPQGAYRVTPISSYGWTTSAQLNIPAVLPAEEVRVLKKVHPLGRHLGMSPLQLGAKNVDLFNAIIDFQWNYFNEGVALDVVVSAPGADEATCQRIKENLTQKHGGARKARSLAVWGGGYGGEPGKGVSVSNLAPAAKDLDFPNGRTTALQELMAFFGTPKILAGYTEDSNYATYIGQVRMFRDMHLKPAFEIVSDFLSKHVAQAWAEDGEELVIACEPQIPRDEEADARELQFAVGQGLVTVNEYRKATGRDAVEDGDLPASAYTQKVQQSIAPPAMPGMDPNAMPGAEQAAPVPGPSGNSPEFSDDEQGTQDATLQAALAALGMGDAPEGEPVQQSNSSSGWDESKHHRSNGRFSKAAVPVNKPGGARKVRQEGETWTGGDGKRWTKRGGKIVPAPQQNTPAAQKPASGTGAAPGVQRYPSKYNAGVTYGHEDDRDADDKAFGKDIRAANKQVAALKQKLAEAEAKLPDNHPVVKQARAGLQAATEKANAARAKADSLKSGTSAAPKQPAPDRGQLHAQILKTKGAKAFGLTPEILAKMPPAAVATMAAQLGLTPPEQHYTPHAAAVPVTPRNKSHLERAHEWADSMAQKHAARVAQRLGIRPEHAQRILAKAIRQVAEHALKNGGKASGTLSVGGQSLRLGVGAKTGTGAAPSKPPTPEALGFGEPDGAGKRPKPWIAKAMNDGSEWLDPAPYGYCPECREPGVRTWRHIGAPVCCAAGHKYPRDRAKYSCAMVELGGEVAEQLKALSKMIAPEDLGEDGIETDPHITARYGLHTSDPDHVREVVNGFGPVSVRLGRVAAFRGSETGKDYDVLFAEVDSPDLVRLHEALGELPHTDTHADYKPHATIGYVKAGRADKYLPQMMNITGECVATEVLFSTPKRKQTVLPLGIAKAMNTLSDPDGGFLVPPAAVPVRKKRRKRPVCEIVRKALQGV